MAKPLTKSPPFNFRLPIETWEELNRRCNGTEPQKFLLEWVISEFTPDGASRKKSALGEPVRMDTLPVGRFSPGEPGLLENAYPDREAETFEVGPTIPAAEYVKVKHPGWRTNLIGANVCIACGAPKLTAADQSCTGVK